MGIPMVVINHTRKQYITFRGSNIDAEELSEFLSLYDELIVKDKWNYNDRIQIKHKNMECATQDKPEKWATYVLLESIESSLFR